MTEEQLQLIANFRYGVIAPLVVRPPARGEQAGMLRELAGGAEGDHRESQGAKERGV